MISCFQTGCESTPRIFHRRAIFWGNYFSVLHIFLDVCVLASLLFCFSVCFFLFCFSLLLCFYVSLFLCFSTFLLCFFILFCFSASSLFRFSAFCCSAFPCFSASLISIYRIYLLEPMFWFKLVFQLFTSMILPARLQLQGSAFACAWFR